MDLRSLRYFVSTVEAGSISAAAIRCHVAQPSITVAISKLEGQLSCKLLVRHQKGCTATEDGVRLYDLAVSLLSHAEAIKQSFTNNSAVATLKLVVDKNIRISVLEAFLADVKKEVSPVKFEIVDYQQKKTADLCLCHKGQSLDEGCFVPLAVEYYSLLLPSNSILAYRKSIEPSDLNNHSVISRIFCENQLLFDQTLKMFAIDVHEVARVDSEEWAHSLVASGVGITFAPVPVDYQHPGIVARSVRELFNIDLPAREVGLMIPKERLASVIQLMPFLFE
jgi:DNA-binding transcriptional LysR family regulator